MAGSYSTTGVKRGTEVDSVDTLFLWVKGGTLGAFSFLMGVALTYFLIADRFIGDAARAVAALGSWRVSAWTYYAAHLVPTENVVIGPNQATLESGSILAELAAADQSLLGLYLLPPSLLLMAGYLTAKRRPAGTSWWRAGAGVLAGYCFIGTIFLVFAQFEGGATVQGLGSTTGKLGPNTWLAVGLTAIAYPAFFGMLGALFGRRAPWNRTN